MMEKFKTQIKVGNAVLAERPSRVKAHRHDWKFSQALLRIREIEKLIQSRHGSVIPDPSGTDDVDLCVAYIRAVALTGSKQKIDAWCSKWAPWLDKVTLKSMERLSSSRRKMPKADAVAKLLCVTFGERRKLHLKSIGACDLSKAARKKIAQATKRDRDRQRQADRRRAEGQQDRQSYEANSLSNLKPWESEGISRRTWERRRAASVSPLLYIGTRDGLASKHESSPSPSVAGVARDGNPGSGWGPGGHPPAGLQGAAPHGICDAHSDTCQRVKA